MSGILAGVRVLETAVGLRHRAPTLGEHTDQILQQLGYSSDEVTRWREEGVV